MSDLAFAELETQIESLPMYQLIILKEKIDNIHKGGYNLNEKINKL